MSKTHLIRSRMSTASFSTEIRPRSIFPYFLVVLLIIAYKSNDALINPQFWAEDATVFFKEQLGHAWPMLFKPYAGYMHVVPRSVAWIASWFSPARIPMIYNTAAVVIDAAAICFVLGRLRGHVPLALGLLSFLLVPTNGEIIGSITNGQWLLQFALAAICFCPEVQTSTAKRWIRAAIALAIALTGPFSLFIITVVAAVISAAWVCNRFGYRVLDGAFQGYWSSRDRLSLLGTAVGAAVQLVLIAGKIPVEAGVHPGTIELMRIAFTELVPIHIFNNSFLPWKAWLLVWGWIIGALLFGNKLHGQSRLLVLSFMATFAIETFLAIRVRPLDLLAQFWPGDRYFYLAKVVFWWSLWMAAANTLSHRYDDARLAVVVLLGLVALGNAPLMRRMPFDDLHWQANAATLTTPGDHVIPINPAPWHITVATSQDGKLQ